jgi:hypothetical protein
MNTDNTRIQDALNYQNDFQRSLARFVREAIGDELIPAAVRHSLYTSKEIIAGTKAGEGASLPATVAATCFAFVSAAALADRAKRTDRTKRTLWGRVKARREPKFGSPEYYHLRIFNVVTPAIDKIGKERVSLFADMFAKELQAVRKAA